MKRKPLVLWICLGGLLLGGCSSKPDVGDIEPVIKSLWKSCNLVNPVSFKKTNGIDHGNSYDVAFSYKLEITRDIAAEDIWDTTLPKAISVGNNILGMAPAEQDAEFKKVAELNAPRRAAHEHLDKFIKQNCPMPMVEHFMNNISDKHGLPLKKGETFDISNAELTMIKSEKGWIAQ